jgi:hypothetical protein
MTTHYDNLQVKRTASDAVIRAAYKSLAQKYHPDRFTGDPAEADRIMKILNEAYFVLSGPDRRRQHDEWIDRQTAEQNSKPSASLRSGQSQGESADEQVVKAKRRIAIGYFLFSAGALIYGLSAWFRPIGGEGWTGNGWLGIPNEYWQIFQRFIGAPFSLLLVVYMGLVVLTGTLMIISPKGIRFSDSGGQMYRWSEVTHCEESDQHIKLRGVRNGKKWEKRLLRSMIDENVENLVQRIRQNIQLSAPNS